MTSSAPARARKRHGVTECGLHRFTEGSRGCAGVGRWVGGWEEEGGKGVQGGGGRWGRGRKTERSYRSHDECGCGQRSQSRIRRLCNHARIARSQKRVCGHIALFGEFSSVFASVPKKEPRQGSIDGDVATVIQQTLVAEYSKVYRHLSQSLRPLGGDFSAS